jgi:hypothetical protein
VLGHQMTTFRLIPAVDGNQFATGTPEITETTGFNMLTVELEAFAASIADRQPFPNPLDQILHGVNVFEAVATSATTGKLTIVKQ